eukprot:331281-Hanusia_phi.AAC.1
MFPPPPPPPPPPPSPPPPSRCSLVSFFSQLEEQSVRTGFVRREKAKQLLAARFPNLDASKGLK